MSTRSGIGIDCGDHILGVYCHSDGYPQEVGKILQVYYREPAKVVSLLNLGDISSLDQDIGEKHPFSDRPEGSSTFYGRDRGDTGTALRAFASREDFRVALRAAGVEYVYLGYVLLATIVDSVYEMRWEVSKPWGRWRSLEDVLEHGVDVLVEGHPDEGPDIVVDHCNGHPGTAILRAGSRVGRGWLSETVDKDFADSVDGVAVTPELLRDFEEHAKRDGLVVDHDNGPARPRPAGSDNADIVVERHVLFGSPMLAVRFQTPTALDWWGRNRNPDVPVGREDVCLCHPKALQAIVGARREGLVVVVEGESK
jgi:hypothetical protein